MPGPSLPTLGGPIGVNLSYTTKAQPAGLLAEYRVDEDQDHIIESSDDVALVRTDSQVSFDWAGAASSPSPGVPAEYFSTKWTGILALPSLAEGAWKIGARSDDGVRVWIDDVLVVDQWSTRDMPAAPDYQSGTSAPGALHSIRVEYFQSTGAAGVELWIRKSVAPDDARVVPAEWLSTAPRVLPQGWSVDSSLQTEYTRAYVADGSVTLERLDGSMLAFRATALGFGYTPPKGNHDTVIVNTDGTIMVHAASGSDYLFAVDGSLLKTTSALEDKNSAVAPQATYDSSGRLVGLKDPVSTRQVLLAYAPSGDCEEDPPVLGGSSFDPAPTGFLCKVSYWDGSATQLYYKNGFLGYVRNPGDAYWGFSYSTNRQMIGWQDPLVFDAAMSGARTDWDKLLVEFAYDASGRVSTITQQPPMQGGSRPGMTYTYSPSLTSNGELTHGTATATRVGVAGAPRQVAYDSRGRQTTEMDEVGMTTTLAYNTMDQTTRADSPGGLRSATIYDTDGRPVDTYGPAPASMFNPDGTGQAGVPHSETEYDEGVDGLAVAWWDNANLSGMPVLHEHDPGTLDSDWGNGSPASGTVGADNFSGRFTGNLELPQPGTYALRLERDSRLAFYLDDTIRIFDWLGTGAGTSPETTVTSSTPNEHHRLRIDYAETSGSAKLKLQWKVPGSSAWTTVPASALKPGYDLVTSTRDANGVDGTIAYTDPVAGLGVEHGVPVEQVIDPGGVNLSQSTRFDGSGPAHYYRPVADVLASGAERTATYYGDTETRDNPCTPTNDPAIQAGRVRSRQDADPDGGGVQVGTKHESVFNEAGRAVAERTGLDDWTCRRYDARGRQIEIRHPAASGIPARTVTFNYRGDPDGAGPRAASPLVTIAADSSGAVTTETDLLGRTISYTDALGNVTSQTYDAYGRELSTNGPQGLLSTTYAGERPASIQLNGQSIASGLIYDAAGRLVGVTYPSGSGSSGNGTVGTFGYDSTGRPSSSTWSRSGGAVITSDLVTRNISGAITDQVIDGVDHHAGADYVYDNAGRLTQAWVVGAMYSYSYEQFAFCTAPNSYKNGNRTTKTVTPTGGSPVSTAYCYDHADRLNVANDPTIGSVTYDNHGNASSIFGETHTYDAADRHVGTTKDTTTVTYVRDVYDRIIERKVNGTTVARYGFAGPTDSPVLTLNAAGDVIARNYLLPGGTLLGVDSVGGRWTYPNLHGDYVAQADGSGTKVGTTLTYSPNGELISGQPIDNRVGEFDFGWLGQSMRPVEQQPGLTPTFEMGERQYSPKIGRFIEEDPINGSLNRYDYSSADPVNQADPTGRYGMIVCDLTPGQTYTHTSAVNRVWRRVGGALEYWWTGYNRRSDIYNAKTRKAYEIKTGRQSLTSSLIGQINTDAKLEMRGKINKALWDFFPSSYGISVSRPLQDYLNWSGIDYGMHLWTNCNCGPYGFRIV